MAGKEYAVQATCPGCVDGGPCPDRAPTGKGRHSPLATASRSARSRRSRRAATAVSAESACTPTSSLPWGTDPDLPGHLPGGSQVRLLGLAKRITPGETLLPNKVHAMQYRGLLDAAQHFGAAPYYALYIQRERSFAPRGRRKAMLPLRGGERVSMGRCRFAAFSTAVALTGLVGCGAPQSNTSPPTSTSTSPSPSTGTSPVA